MKNKYLLDMVTPSLRDTFLEVDKRVEVHVLPSTIRTMEQQQEYVRKGTSKTMNSKHLIIPGVRSMSEAVDAGPYPFEWPRDFDWNSLSLLPVDTAQKLLKRWSEAYWKDWARLYYFAGLVLEVGRRKGVNIRYGGDWNGNYDLKDQNFYDGVHFEEVK